uniref:Uncharacterized protein n=1 Tax=Timema tahoe TaxID=61484 RepID=A0A7R9IC97_9NEOP|nr:unnamed protein product [Timema tahoe]
MITAAATCFDKPIVDTEMFLSKLGSSLVLVVEPFKNIGTKAEDLLEKKKHDVEDLGEKKKQAASELLEEQAKKTGDLVWSTKDELEKAVLGGLADAGAKVAGGAGQAVDSATKAKHSAIDALDEEFSKVEKTVDGTLDTASSALDEKLKEADKLIDQKRDDVVKAVTDTASKAHETKDDAASSLLEKAKGLFHCEYSVRRHSKTGIREPFGDGTLLSWGLRPRRRELSSGLKMGRQPVGDRYVNVPAAKQRSLNSSEQYSTRHCTNMRDKSPMKWTRICERERENHLGKTPLSTTDRDRTPISPSGHRQSSIFSLVPYTGKLMLKD